MVVQFSDDRFILSYVFGEGGREIVLPGSLKRVFPVTKLKLQFFSILRLGIYHFDKPTYVSRLGLNYNIVGKPTGHTSTL